MPVELLNSAITASAIIGGALIQAKVGLPFKNWKTNREIQYFRGPTGGSKYNEKFYELFAEKISNATGNIYVTGEGMEFSDPEGEQFAKKYFRSYVNALTNGALIVRLQTKKQIHPKWAKMLAELYELYPEHFSLYVLNNPNDIQISSFCVIDDHCSRKCTAEIMLPIEGDTGDENIKLAGPAFFINGNQLFARELKKEVLALIKDSLISTKYENREKILELGN